MGSVVSWHLLGPSLRYCLMGFHTSFLYPCVYYLGSLVPPNSKTCQKVDWLCYISPGCEWVTCNGCKRCTFCMVYSVIACVKSFRLSTFLVSVSSSLLPLLILKCRPDCVLSKISKFLLEYLSLFLSLLKLLFGLEVCIMSDTGVGRPVLHMLLF